MNNYAEIYKIRFDKLNTAQQLAVSTIHGPVMVIAGPGTGKTEVLGMRIANMLQSDAQILPSEILCLTYTDEAARNMRKRLSSIVGADAQRVSIYTFHSFCNSIIQEFHEYFSNYELEPISDLERIDILQSLLDNVDVNNPLFRTGQSEYYDTKKLNNLFSTMKKENWSSKRVLEAIDEYLNDLPNREEYIYKKKNGENQAGDIKKAEIEKVEIKMAKTSAAAQLFDQFNIAMKNLKRYDYDDMLLWIIEAFNNNSFLIQHYQERFQYILVDEFQDTNGAQIDILNLLCQYWGEQANIFIVGDDDQSIYEFQGANIRNIENFYNKYKNEIKVITLTENYRSTQLILDCATQSIDNNSDRIVKKLSHLNIDKTIIAASKKFDNIHSIKPQINSYINPFYEASHIVSEIQKLISDGTPPHEIAILFKEHKQINTIIKLLSHKKIPYSYSKSINVLEEPLIKQINNIIEYLILESKNSFSAEHILFGILHNAYFGIEPIDIAQLSIYLRSSDAKEKQIKHWRQLLAQELILSNLNLSSLTNILKVSRLLDTWIQHLKVLRIPMLVENIVYDSGIINWCLSQDNASYQIMVLQSYINFVTQNSDIHTTLEELLNNFSKMIREEISLPLVNTIKSNSGINLYTVHSAKGLEFEHVYLIGVNKEGWDKDKNINRSFVIPQTLISKTLTSGSSFENVSRRMFYVALTRAKRCLNISYNETNIDDKKLEMSLLINEIISTSEVVNLNIDTHLVLKDIELILNPTDTVYIQLLDKEILKSQLNNFKLSYTSLSKYLKCPIAFYYENVLCCPNVQNDNMAFGTAVHYALEHAFVLMQKDPEHKFPNTEVVLNYFNRKLKDLEVAFTETQLRKRKEKGNKIIREYYEENINSFSKNVKLEAWFEANIDIVPIRGKIDKIELLPQNHCVVIDYKTGNPSSPYTKANISSPNDTNDMLGGDYWRQMIFYALLIESSAQNSLRVTNGRFDYIEKNANKFTKEYIPIIEEHKEIVKNQILNTYYDITNFKFDTGCGEPTCKWCEFVKDKNINLSPSSVTDDE